MYTKSDAELESIYKTGHGASHTHALREVYQAGRADEQAAIRGVAAEAVVPPERATPSGAKRPIKTADTVGGTSQTDVADPALAGGLYASGEAPTAPPTSDPNSTPLVPGVESAAGEAAPLSA